MEAIISPSTTFPDQIQKGKGEIVGLWRGSEGLSVKRKEKKKVDPGDGV